ncbi:MAG: hypothetical protein K2W96_00685 [Gemmataceae bacterium]|nr:hypothetical protein [Gemmataceae bacterium]
MNKTVWAVALGWACWASPAAFGQFYYTRPVTNPLAASRGGFYSPLYYGNPGALGTYSVPGGLGYGAPVVGGYGLVPLTAGTGTTALGTRSLDATAAWQTGHPVRFQAYRGYFQNPTAALLGGGVLSTGGNASNPVLGTGQRNPNVPGKRPARGKDAIER